VVHRARVRQNARARPRSRVPERHGGVARNDTELTAAPAAEFGDHLLREAAAEKILAVAAFQLGKWQHRQADTRRARIEGVLALEVRDESIASPGDRLDEARVVGIIAERGTQALDGGVQAMFEIDVRPRGPERVPQLLARDHPATAFEEHAQDEEWLLLKADSRVSGRQRACVAVQRKGAEMEDGTRLDGHESAANRCQHALIRVSAKRAKAQMSPTCHLAPLAMPRRGSALRPTPSRGVPAMHASLAQCSRETLSSESATSRRRNPPSAPGCRPQIGAPATPCGMCRT
jgi:hypothetical protein